MSRPRFLIDHNVPDAILRGLARRDASIEAVRLREIGLQKASDPDLLEFAAINRWLLVTLDVSTMIGFAHQRIVVGNPMPGLFVLTEMKRPYRPFIDDLYLVWSCSEFEEWENMVEYLPW